MNSMTITEKLECGRRCLDQLQDEMHWQIRGSTRDMRAPLGPIFSIFMQFLRKIGQNNRLAFPPFRFRAPIWEILDPPLEMRLALPNAPCQNFATENR